MKIVDKYKLSKYRDYGALGEKESVHLVRDEEKGRMCVKKIMSKELKHIVEFRLNNPSVYFPEVYEYFEQDEELILIEEFIEGITLEQFTMGESLAEEKAVCFAYQICSALQILHNTKPMIVYRDLKPQNIMVTEDEQIKLVDFNISREYEKSKKKDTMLLGTAGYAAPEQFGFFQTDNRTDIYAFGIVFQYMLIGQKDKEYVGKNKYQELIRKCVEFEPSNRFQKIEDVVIALKRPKQSYKSSSKKSWVLPGFRTKIIWKMLTGFIGYMLAFMFAIILSEGKNFFVRVISFFAMFIIFLLMILLAFNYRGIADGSKYLMHKNVIVRMFSACIVGLGLMLCYSIIRSMCVEVLHITF